MKGTPNRTKHDVYSNPDQANTGWTQHLQSFIRFSKQIINYIISCPYLESLSKMHKNEPKHAYVWSSGSWDSLGYFHNQVIFFSCSQYEVKKGSIDVQSFRIDYNQISIRRMVEIIDLVANTFLLFFVRSHKTRFNIFIKYSIRIEVELLPLEQD